MTRARLPGLPRVCAAGLLAWAIFPAPLVRAQSVISRDQKDQEIAELKKEIKLLEQRVGTLEGLDQKVRVIDRKLEVQAEADQTKAKEAPIIKASSQGFSISSPNDDYQIKFGGIIQGDSRFFTS